MNNKHWFRANSNSHIIPARKMILLQITSHGRASNGKNTPQPKCFTINVYFELIILYSYIVSLPITYSKYVERSYDTMEKYYIDKHEKQSVKRNRDINTEKEIAKLQSYMRSTYNINIDRRTIKENNDVMKILKS